MYIEVDGTSRELHPDERTYLETEFDGADGARPYIKTAYQELDGWGDLSGYLHRSKLPAGTLVKSAPFDVLSRQLSRDEYTAFLRAKGFDVTENADGTFTTGRVEVHWVGQDGDPEGEGDSPKLR